jgi:hypothetical protein
MRTLLLLLLRPWWLWWWCPSRCCCYCWRADAAAVRTLVEMLDIVGGNRKAEARARPPQAPGAPFFIIDSTWRCEEAAVRQRRLHWWSSSYERLRQRWHYFNWNHLPVWCHFFVLGVVLHPSRRCGPDFFFAFFPFPTTTSSNDNSGDCCYATTAGRCWYMLYCDIIM